MSKKCMEKTEVYSRVVGYFRPVQQWNKGKQEEFKDRREFEVQEECTAHECHSGN
jgi:anaerobic ribonucleoside-triphosphate reductase